MGILSNRGGNRKWSEPRESKCDKLHSPSNARSVGNERQWSDNQYTNLIIRFIRSIQSTKLHTNNTRWSIPVHSKLSRTWHDKPNNNSKNNNNRKRNRYYKYIYTIAALFVASPTYAEGVGGVSATANPIANSSGSVTNQAIQVLQGPYITNTYGNGVSCQGRTLNITPYFQFADSRKHPWEDFYNEPQYNTTDITGRMVDQTRTVKNYPWETWYNTTLKSDGTRWFADGDDMEITEQVPAGDGVPDAVTNQSLDPIWYKPIRTDMRANQSLNLGISATLSIPLNKKLRDQCEQAAQAQINHQVQLTSNKRLDFELARLKNCGELKKAGIFFHPQSQYASICSDVVVTAPGGQVMPHEHNLPQPKWNPPTSSATPSSKEADPLNPDTYLIEPRNESTSSLSYQTFSSQNSSPSSQQVSQPDGGDLLGVWQIGQTLLPQ